jgi:hypothetical protein
MTTIRHTFEAGTELNPAEREAVNRRLNARQGEITFPEIMTRAKNWNVVHSPTDRATKLNLFQYVIQEGQGGALVPFQAPDVAPLNPTVEILPHAFSQLLERLEFAKKTYERLPDKLNVLNMNWLIQNYYNKDVLLRLIDGNKVRALMSSDYEPFDNLELLQAIEPYCQDAEVKWAFDDDLTTHISVVWPKTQEVIRVGDVVQRGIHISNSEVGMRSVTVAAYVYRLKCSNGAIGGGEGGGMYRFRHVGDSDRLRDQVKAAIESTHLESTKILAQFKASLEKAIEDPFNYMERVAKDKTNDMTQEQFKAAMDAFLIEPESNLFGVTNAITRAAQKFEGETRFDMERLGTKVLNEGLKN